MHASHVAAAHRKGKRRSCSPRKVSEESGKKQQRTSNPKRPGSSGWVPVSTDGGCWVLGVKGEMCSDIRNHDTAIVSGSLFARAIPAATLDVGMCHRKCIVHFIMYSSSPGDHLPRRPDSMFLHPDTMHLCGFAIAQPVAVRNVSRPNSGIVICKPWPFKKINLGCEAL